MGATTTAIEQSLFPEIVPDRPFAAGAASAQLCERLREARQPDMIRVGPNVWAWRPKDPQRVPVYGLHKWVPCGDGSFRPIPLQNRFVVVSREVLDGIGLRGMSKRVSDTTLRRLAVADEICMFHIAPKVRMLDVDSWFRFLDDCASNVEKWDPGSESYRNYMFRNALGEHRKRKRKALKGGSK